MGQQFNQQIQDHRSIRKYKPKSINSEILTDIITSGIRSSTSSNMQFYSIIQTKDSELKEQLYKAHGEQKMVMQAPVVFTFCCDQRRIKNWMKQSGVDYAGENFLGFMRGVIDVCLVAQNMAIAAEAYGIGICYMGSTLTSATQISEILNLPQHVFPVTSLVMGYPDGQSEKVDRLPIEAVLHKEKYQILSEEEIEQLYRQREESTFARFKTSGRFGSLIAEKDLKNISQVYTETKFSLDYLSEMATLLLQHYKDQGFT
ncbi:nitroreductase family protein [Bacteriovoracaceae bacterium]|nr:nitroreductase family protein [Bacteriovoracaceae bacterium]